jgi:hypothetical protein
VTVEGAILAGRTAAESLMVDTGIMRRSAGRTEQNPFTDEETEVYADLFASRCKIQTRNLQASTRRRSAVARRSPSLWSFIYRSLWRKSRPATCGK